MSSFPKLGQGVGLRRKHYPELFADPSLAKRVDWFEVISENFMGPGGKPLDVLDRIRATHPIVLHGVSLSIGSADPLNEEYLEELARIERRFEPAMVSDHLCWGSIDGNYAHDLLPLPYTEEEIGRIASRVQRVQDRLKRRILIENVSSYLTWRHSGMPEWEFLAAVAEKADCGILLDVNNIYVSSKNHRFDPLDYLNGVPPKRVAQFHLAGHQNNGTHLIDTHDGPVIDPVWDLYRAAVARFGKAVPTLIEWDDKIPDFLGLVAESDKAKAIAASVSPEKEPAGTAPHRPAPPAAVTTAETQRVFWDLISAPEGAASAKSAPQIDRLIVGDELSSLFRADIYAHMYFDRQKDALREDYPAVAAVLGEDGFHNLMVDFLQAHPSHHPSLRFLGEPLPRFLESHSAAKETPWLPDLARLEWARVDAFDAADAEPIDPNALGSVAPDRWEALTFRLHPSVRVVEAGYRVDVPWKEVDEEKSPRPPEPAQGAFRVWREEFTVYHAWMEPLEAKLFGMLLEGRTFGELCGAAAVESGDPDQAARSVLGFLRAWLSCNLVVGYGVAKTMGQMRVS